MWETNLPRRRPMQSLAQHHRGHAGQVQGGGADLPLYLARVVRLRGATTRCAASRGVLTAGTSGGAAASRGLYPTGLSGGAAGHHEPRLQFGMRTWRSSLELACPPQATCRHTRRCYELGISYSLGSRREAEPKGRIDGRSIIGPFPVRRLASWTSSIA